MTSQRIIRIPRRSLLAAALLLAAGPALATDYPEINWDDLMPKGWDPTQSLPGIDKLGTLPDTDPRVGELYEQLRKAWDNAPTVPAMQGKVGKIAGYLVPLEQTKDGVTEFLLVPYFGACIHLPPPPANQIIHVRPATPVSGIRTMATIWVSGRLDLQWSNSEMGVSGYSMSADSVVRHRNVIGKP